jgi:hypothetical protein
MSCVHWSIRRQVQADIPPVVSKHHAGTTSIVNTKSRTSITTRLVLRPDASTKGSAKTIIRSGVNSPSPGGTLTTQPSYEASLSTRQTENEILINKEQTRRLRHPPVPLTTRLHPKLLPTSSVQDRPSHLPNGEFRQPYQAVPRKKPSARDAHEAVVKGETGERSYAHDWCQ